MLTRAIAAFTLLLTATACSTTPPTNSIAWRQWGGPHQNFTAPDSGLADAWPEGGPKMRWSRDLGPGYSAIVADGARLYTMTRDHDANEEIVLALNPDSGETIWRHAYGATPYEGMDNRFGLGPNATPLIVGDRVYTLGAFSHLHCLDAKTGKIRWSRHLINDDGASTFHFGYSASPIHHDGKIIVCAGGKPGFLLAFDPISGEPIWKSETEEMSYSTPIVAKLAGRDHLIVMTAIDIAGFDPRTGRRLWSHPHVNQWRTNISTPNFGADQILYLSSGGEAGSRALQLSTDASGAVGVKELWAEIKSPASMGSFIRVGDHIYCTSGDMGPAFLTAINLHTGEVAWRERGFAKGNLIHADGKTIFLDEKGVLALLDLTPEGMSVRAQCQMLEETAWTAPTLVGKTLYLRDKKRIVALELG
jgi:outer membrane protein assembly factor BamB